MDTWERQKREIRSYNHFYSAIEHKHKTKGLINYGYRLVGPFVSVNDHRNSIQVEPDFTLFDGESILFIEVKSGENIDNPKDIEQMDIYNDLGREAIEQFLKDTPITENHLDPNNVQHSDHAIVYYEDFISKCRNEWENCKKALKSLESVSPVLTQEPGGQLVLDSGSFESDKLERILSSGISVPERVPKQVYLTENIELECLAFSICYDIVLNNIGNDSCLLTVSGVRDFYGRRIPIYKVERVFEFLEEVNACRENSDGEYVFRRNSLGEIMAIEEKISAKPVDDYLEDDEDQTDLEDFT